jgi:hypothetical protein
MKVVLKSWAKHLPNLATKRKKIQSALELHHLHSEDAEITKEALDKEAQLQQNFHKAWLAEEEYWRKKSRSLWLKAGDKNSSFFHKQAQARKWSNAILEIKEENITHKDNTSIKRATFLHFKNLYYEEEEMGQNSKLLEVVPLLITTKMNQLLEAKVTKSEVKDALYAMDPDKAPGLDGFTTRFL